MKIEEAAPAAAEAEPEAEADDKSEEAPEAKAAESEQVSHSSPVSASGFGTLSLAPACSFRNLLVQVL